MRFILSGVTQFVVFQSDCKKLDGRGSPRPLLNPPLFSMFKSYIILLIKTTRTIEIFFDLL